MSGTYVLLVLNKYLGTQLIIFDVFLVSGDYGECEDMWNQKKTNKHFHPLTPT